MLPLDDLAIVIVAAGTSTRMGTDKLWADLGGAPLMQRALLTVERLGAREMVLVVGEQRREAAALLAPWARVVVGGPRRRDSVAAGVRATACTWVAVHDAARPLVPGELFTRGLAAAIPIGAAVPVIPMKDTVKRISNGLVDHTVDRSSHFAVQTPQLFRRADLLRAFASTEVDVTDEAALLESLGLPVAVFAGHEENFKVTTPIDLLLARLIVAERAAGR